MDVLAVEAATRRAAEAVRRGEGPAFLEFRTYRFRAHSMFDAELYRSRAEVEQWKKRCPLETFKQKLKMEGLLDDRGWTDMEADVEAEIAAAVSYAEAGTWEPVEQLTHDVYTQRAA
jgi:pyruvate dehydrogenase E1 component subunit alpha